MVSMMLLLMMLTMVVVVTNAGYDDYGRQYTKWGLLSTYSFNRAMDV